MRTLKLTWGDRLCIYSDGVPETLNGELESFTKEHLIAVWREERSHDLRTATENLLRAVAQWCGMSGPKDDVSILGLEVA